MINIFYLVELISDICFRGFVNCLTSNFRAYPETLCQIINFVLWYNKFLGGKGDYVHYNFLIRRYESIIFARSIKLLTLVYEIKTMRIVFEAMRQMIIPLCKLLVVQLLIYYIFALFGMLMFGGKITLNNQ